MLKNLKFLLRFLIKTKFQDLEIKLIRCRKSGSQEKKKTSQCLRFTTLHQTHKREQYFYGWMFSSSPALSAMEHPIYDVIVLECTE